MPEGPSIFIARETISPVLKGKAISKATGQADIDMTLLNGKKIKAIRSWGKHLLFCLPNGTIRIHFLMFGTYSIGKQTRQNRSLKLKLQIGKQSVYFYTCAVRWLPGAVTDHYDWKFDLLDKKWNAAKVRKKLKQHPDDLVCDALLDQEIFAGSGNIIKNEVLYRVRLHPETMVGDIPARKLTQLVKETQQYSFDFLKWKKEGTLKKHWEAYTKKKCHRCNLPFHKSYCGKTKRRTFYCEGCQELYK